MRINGVIHTPGFNPPEKSHRTPEKTHPASGEEPPNSGEEPPNRAFFSIGSIAYTAYTVFKLNPLYGLKQGSAPKLCG
jgi:hypothetical protein